MPQVIVPPTVDDSQLLFDEAETREILAFFWPAMSSQIDSLAVANKVRRFAQSLLIAGIDATYAMGYVQILFETVAKPKGGLKAMGKKLAKRYMKHWFKHAKPQQLEDVKIYESVRATIARNFNSAFRIMLTETQAPVRLTPFYVASVTMSQAWV